MAFGEGSEFRLYRFLIIAFSFTSNVHLAKKCSLSSGSALHSLQVGFTVYWSKFALLAYNVYCKAI